MSVVPFRRADKWVEGHFAIAVLGRGGKPTTIQASGFVRGPFAVEDDTVLSEGAIRALHAGDDPPPVSVTHVPSGYRVCRAKNTKAGMAIADALRQLPMDWSFTDPADAKPFNDLVVQIVRRRGGFP